MRETLKKIIDEIELSKQLTKGGTNERAMIFNAGLLEAVKIVKKYLLKDNSVV